MLLCLPPGAAAAIPTRRPVAWLHVSCCRQALRQQPGWRKGLCMPVTGLTHFGYRGVLQVASLSDIRHGCVCVSKQPPHGTAQLLQLLSRSATGKRACARCLSTRLKMVARRADAAAGSRVSPSRGQCLLHCLHHPSSMAAAAPASPAPPSAASPDPPGCRGSDSASSPPTDASCCVSASTCCRMLAVLARSAASACCFSSICDCSTYLSVWRACVAAAAGGRQAQWRRRQRAGLPASHARAAPHLQRARHVEQVAHVVQRDHDLRQGGRVRARLLHQHHQQLPEQEQQALVQLEQLALDVCEPSGSRSSWEGRWLARARVERRCIRCCRAHLLSRPAARQTAWACPAARSKPHPGGGARVHKNARSSASSRVSARTAAASPPQQLLLPNNKQRAAAASTRPLCRLLCQTARPAHAGCP